MSTTEAPIHEGMPSEAMAFNMDDTEKRARNPFNATTAEDVGIHYDADKHDLSEIDGAESGEAGSGEHDNTSNTERLEENVENNSMDQQSVTELLTETGMNDLQANLIAAHIRVLNQAVEGGDSAEIVRTYDSFKNVLNEELESGHITEEDKEASHRVLGTIVSGETPDNPRVSAEDVQAKEDEENFGELAQALAALGNLDEAKDEKGLGADLAGENYDIAKASESLKEIGVNDTAASTFADIIGVLGKNIEKGNAKEIEIQLERYIINLKANIQDGHINDEQKEAIEALLKTRLGDEGMAEIFAHVKLADNKVFNELDNTFDDIGIYRTILGKANIAKRNGDIKTYNWMLGLAYENIDRVAEKEGWDDEATNDRKMHIRSMFQPPEPANGSNTDQQPTPSVDTSTNAGADVDNTVAAAPEANRDDKKRISRQIKKRWTALMNALRNPSNREHWKDAFGNEKGEKAKRNAVVAGLGVAAVGFATVWASAKGFDYVVDSSLIEGFDIPDAPDAGLDIPDAPDAGDVPNTPNPLDFGLDLNQDMPWTVAHEIVPGQENSAIQAAMDAYSQQIGVEVSFTGSGTNTMIQVGDRIANPSDVQSINEIMFNQFT